MREPARDIVQLGPRLDDGHSVGEPAENFDVASRARFLRSGARNLVKKLSKVKTRGLINNF